MSVFCPKCGKRTYDEYKCDYCQHEIKPKKIIKSNKEITIINKNTVLVIAVVAIAISVAYLGISKYRENKAVDEFAKMFLGTSDPEEIKAMTKKSIDELKHTLSNPPTFKMPEIKIKESQYEKERRLKKEHERRVELQKQISMNKSQRDSEKAKKELKKQMSF
jgi:hypothetical protein